MGLNYQLIKTLNPTASLSWNVVYNKTLYMHKKKRTQLIRTIAGRMGKHKTWPATEAERAEADALVEAEIAAASDPGEVADYIPEALVLKGYKPKQVAPQFEAMFGEDIAGMETRVYKYLASYLHAAGLNIALRESKTRYSIVLDPDFYIVQENWIGRILGKMEKENLAIFGAPWNPRWYQKFQNFPCSHLMVIDHQKIPFTPNLLSPELVRPGPKFVSKTFMDLAKLRDPRTLKRKRHGFIGLAMKNLPSLPVEDWRQRKTIGASRDTGYKLAERARCDDAISYAMATPVFHPRIEGFHPEVVFPWQRAPFVEFFLPATRRYMPRARAYSKTGFLERGFPNFRVLNWEEFLLDDEPFAFHVRGELQRGAKLGIDLHPAWLGLCAILERKGLPILPRPAPAARAQESAAA
jgi:hypothetical protein